MNHHWGEPIKSKLTLTYTCVCSCKKVVQKLTPDARKYYTHYELNGAITGSAPTCTGDSNQQDLFSCSATDAIIQGVIL